jgi:hypothetical protein
VRERETEKRERRRKQKGEGQEAGKREESVKEKLQEGKVFPQKTRDSQILQISGNKF